MIRFEGQEVNDEFEAAFGRPLSSLTKAQLWWLVKFGKHLRGRCRSNAALNNYMNRTFVHAQVREIPKIDPYTDKEYKGLEIITNGLDQVVMRMPRVIQE